MVSPKVGTRRLKTMRGLTDRRRLRTSAGALMELSIMSNEKNRLQMELERGRARQAEINARLAEIAEKERRLYEFVNKPIEAAPAPPALNKGQRLRTTELSY